MLELQTEDKVQDDIKGMIGKDLDSDTSYTSYGIFQVLLRFY